MISQNKASINAYTNSQTFVVLPTFICFYIFYLYLFPSFLARKKISLFIISGLATWVTLTLMTVVLLKNLLINPWFDKPPLQFWFQVSAPDILFAGVIGCFFKGFVTWYSEIRVKEQLVQKNLKSELALLKAQINPHFLFNTINNIDILIEKDSKAASAYLKQLSEIMRFMLYDVSSEYIPLTKELEYIEKYIALQKIRTANEKYVNFSISGATKDFVIAPAIFIPFIENAFKHSTNKKIENAINIKIEIGENDLSFSCVNYFENSNSFEQERSGLGIDLIKQRLQLLYKDKHELEITKTDNRFEVLLKIKIR
jgi:hypothetical protein